MRARCAAKAIAFVAVLCAAAGCGGSDTPAASGEFQAIATLYQAYVAEHRAPPKNEAEFKRFISERGAKLLEANGVKSVDALFISTRDGQPLKVVYAPDKAKYGRLAVFEQQGADGKRMVAGSLGSPSLADEAEFREMSAPGGA